MNRSDLITASSQFDMLLCSETLVSDMRHVSELLVPGFGRLLVPGFGCAGTGCLESVGWKHMYEMDLKLFANPNSSVVIAKCWFLGFAV